MGRWLFVRRSLCTLLDFDLTERGDLVIFLSAIQLFLHLVLS